MRFPPRLFLRVPTPARPSSACAMQLRDAAPFRRGFDRPRKVRTQPAAAAAEAPADHSATRGSADCDRGAGAGRTRGGAGATGGAGGIGCEAMSSASAFRASRCGRCGVSVSCGGMMPCSSVNVSIRGARRGCGGGDAAGGSGWSGHEPLEAGSGSGSVRGRVVSAASGRAEGRRRATPAPPARCWIRRRRPSARRSSPDVRCCRGGPACSRRRASTVVYSITASRGWRPRAEDAQAGRRQIGGPPMRSPRSAPARSGMPGRNVRRAAFPRRTDLEHSPNSPFRSLHGD